MKFKENEKYTTISVYAIIVIAISITLIMLMTKTEKFIGAFNTILSIFNPFIIGGILAYLINFILVYFANLLEHLNFYKKLSFAQKRVIGILISYLVILLLITIFVSFVLPQLIESITGLVNNIPIYLNKLSEVSTKIANNIDLENAYLEPVVTKLIQNVNDYFKFIAELIPRIGNVFISLTARVFNLFIGFIISIYILNDKEKLAKIINKISYAFFSQKTVNKIKKNIAMADDVFGKFLVGKIVDSIIIGILTFIILSIFNFPYTILISVTIGITNIIPFFGPFIGAIPSAIILLLIAPNKFILFILIIFIIQQIDGNIIGPKILGNSIGISSFWVLFALLIFSKLLGVAGMVIGVPAFAVVYNIIREIVTEKLNKKNIKI